MSPPQAKRNQDTEWFVFFGPPDEDGDREYGLRIGFKGKFMVSLVVERDTPTRTTDYEFSFGPVSTRSTHQGWFGSKVRDQLTAGVFDIVSIPDEREVEHSLSILGETWGSWKSRNLAYEPPSAQDDQADDTPTTPSPTTPSPSTERFVRENVDLFWQPDPVRTTERYGDAPRDGSP